MEELNQTEEQTQESEVTATHVAESDYSDLIERLQKRELSLSYSSFKWFHERVGCPWMFVQNKIMEKKSTKAMDLGSMIDVLLFEPWKGLEGFVVIPSGCDFSSTEGLTNYAKFCEEMGLTSVDDIMEPVEKMVKGKLTLAAPVLAEKKARVRAALERLPAGTTIVSQADLQLAQFIASRVQSSNRVMDLLEKCPQENAQYPVEFEAFGWKWRGRLDQWSDAIQRPYTGFVLDGKLMPSARSQDAVRVIRNMAYDIQGSIYRRGMQEKGFNLPHIILAYDRQGNYNLIEVPKRALDSAWQELEAMMKRFNSLVIATELYKDAFKESYTFWGNYSGVYEMQ